MFVATLHLYVINTFDVQFYVNMKLFGVGVSLHLLYLAFIHGMSHADSVWWQCCFWGVNRCLLSDSITAAFLFT